MPVSKKIEKVTKTKAPMLDKVSNVRELEGMGPKTVLSFLQQLDITAIDVRIIKSPCILFRVCV